MADGAGVLSGLAISPRQRLDDALRVTAGLPFGPTDCALPMQWALREGRAVDTFVVYTDNETWHGSEHPHQALRRYRQATGIPARLVAVSYTHLDVYKRQPRGRTRRQGGGAERSRGLAAQGPGKVVFQQVRVHVMARSGLREWCLVVAAMSVVPFRRRMLMAVLRTGPLMATFPGPWLAAGGSVECSQCATLSRRSSVHGAGGPSAFTGCYDRPCPRFVRRIVEPKVTGSRMRDVTISHRRSAGAPRPLVLVVYGTRPEAIKAAPLVLGLRDRGRADVQVITTGQHRHMLDQVNEVFGIEPDHDLGLFEPGQGIESIVAKTLLRLTPVLHELRPDAVVVHGDTSTANASAQAAFYAGVPVVHLEAGLRTYDLASPFPEEANRQIVGRLATLHLAPTERNRQALLAEQVPGERIVVTGNTVIDALHSVVDRISSGTALYADRRRVLVTLHRRENLGETMAGVARALARVAGEAPDVCFVVPLHLNPAVRRVVIPILQAHSNLSLILI